MNNNRNHRFRGFQSNMNKEGLLEFDLDPKKMVRNFLLKSLVCCCILAVLFTMRAINTNGTNRILNSIDARINSNFEYESLLSKIKEIPKYALQKGDKVLEVINITGSDPTQYSMPVQGEIVSFFDQSSTSSQTNDRGIIIDTNVNEKVVASQAGTVMETGVMDNIGTYVIIKHKGNMLTIYKYLEESLVKNNQPVKQGDIIGAATDKVQFEMWEKNNPVDPLRYVSLK